MRICEPAQLYLGLSVLFILLGFITRMVSVNAILIKLLFTGLWTWVLSILCNKKMKELAWAFVMLPFVIIGSSIIYGGMGLIGREGFDVGQATYSKNQLLVNKMAQAFQYCVGKHNKNCIWWQENPVSSEMYTDGINMGFKDTDITMIKQNLNELPPSYKKIKLNLVN